VQARVRSRASREPDDAAREELAAEEKNQLQSVHVRHLHVRDDYVGRLQGEDAKRFPPILGFRHFKTFSHEHRAQQPPEAFLVVDH
jgi:hypothetical protein